MDDGRPIGGNTARGTVNFFIGDAADLDAAEECFEVIEDIDGEWETVCDDELRGAAADRCELRCFASAGAWALLADPFVQKKAESWADIDIEDEPGSLFCNTGYYFC